MFVGVLYTFYLPVAMEMIGKPDINYLDGWVNNFGNMVSWMMDMFTIIKKNKNKTIFIYSIVQKSPKVN